jgi:hypothetical protein
MITVTNLRKIFTEQGIKGASKWKREDFESTIIAAEFAAHEEAARLARIASAPKRNADGGTKRGTCTECGRKEDFRASGLCKPCREYAEWENTHADENHADQQVVEDCPVCHPELDPRKPVAKREGRSRAGMVIVAKGSEIHKSLVLKTAAEAIGWTVEIERETYELPEGAEGEGTRYYATATRGADSISLAWDGRAYDYPASSALIGGKSRKVRNLKEALRLLAA